VPEFYEFLAASFGLTGRPGHQSQVPTRVERFAAQEQGQGTEALVIAKPEPVARADGRSPLLANLETLTDSSPVVLAGQPELGGDASSG